MLVSGSFKKYTDMIKNQVDEMESGGRAATDASQQLDRFTHEVELIKQDARAIEKLQKRINESNEESRAIQLAAKVRELRAHMDSDVDRVLKLAKSIVQRIEGLETLSNHNPPDRRISSAGSSIERTRVSVVMGLGKKLRDLMDGFQGLRVRIAAVHKETIESKYFSITGEKIFIETIEKLAANGEIEDCLTEAIQEQGRDRVLDFVAEIHERQEGSKNMQRNLVELHQMFLDMTALAETQAQKMANVDGDQNQVVRGNSYLNSTGVAQLQDQPVDYDREAKRRATIGLILAVFLVFMIIIPVFVAESNRDQE